MRSLDLSNDRRSNLSAAVAQSFQLKFLHKSGITLRPGGTPEIGRWCNHRDRDHKNPSPGGATDRSRSIAPPGLGGSTGLVPVVPPPANLHRASGAKTYAETLAFKVARISLPDYRRKPRNNSEVERTSFDWRLNVCAPSFAHVAPIRT